MPRFPGLFIFHMEIWIELEICRVLSTLGCEWRNNEKKEFCFISERIFNYIYIQFQCSSFTDNISKVFRHLTYHLHMPEEKLKLEGTGCKNLKANDLQHFSASTSQDFLHWAMLLSCPCLSDS